MNVTINKASTHIRFDNIPVGGSFMAGLEHPNEAPYVKTGASGAICLDGYFQGFNEGFPVHPVRITAITVKVVSP